METITLSPDARQAIAFLFSPHAAGLTCRDARVAITDVYGVGVVNELEQYFGYSQPDQEKTLNV